jgi:outer membrane lipoprotein-sorting protein
MKMKHSPYPGLLLLLLMMLGGLSLSAQTPADIIRKSEETRRGIESSYAEMTMTIIRPTWQRAMSLKSWSEGDENALILVTAPARDKGMATLKRDKEVWNWMPRIERTVKLPPSMMSQSWMGSDFTNDDLVREVSLITDYEHELLESEIIEGRKCWKISLVPHEDVAVVWGKVIMYIDQQDYLQLKSEFYDEDGYLVNIMTASNIQTMDGRKVATHMEIIPQEEAGHKTVLDYDNLKFETKIPANFFTVQNMKRVR